MREETGVIEAIEEMKLKHKGQDKGSLAKWCGVSHRYQVKRLSSRRRAITY
ncbi:hypothetical protein V7S43_004778 [Phytophthora oleae]|uniref:HTH psq-type domain-containing protein n=1 Tax=Phytophthora oleae TaxID=2107226 RepID=A0ABD3FZS9_9STRA